MKLVTFIVLLVIAATMAAHQEEKQCSPWLQPCLISDDCCRYLICSFYAAKCVPKSGLIVPGEDNRPLGPGPYPPNVPLD